MGKLRKICERILFGTSDTKIAFAELCFLLRNLEFNERIKGSHHIFYRDNVEEIINIQEKNGKAKPYQVKQVRTILLRYRLGVSDDR